MRRSAVRLLTAGLLAGVVWPAAPAAAEPFFDLYTGKSDTGSADVRVKQPAVGNDFTFKSVAFDDESFEDPPWYGLRAGYFLEGTPWLGVALEFFHFKIVGEVGETRQLVGTRGGVPVDTTARVDSVVQQFQITHGVNYLTVDALVRYRFLEDPERFPRGRVQLYGGVGVGPVIAHAETRIEGVKHEAGYELGGAGLQAFAGVRVMLLRYLGLFVEGKITYSRLSVEVTGGEGRVSESSRHIVGGITVVLP